MTAMQDVRPVQLDSPRSVLGECPVWDPVRRTLVYLDYLQPRVIAFDEHTGSVSSKPVPLRPPLGGLCLRRTGGYLIFNQDGVHLMNDELEIIAPLFPPHPSFAEAPPNDVCVDEEGRVLVATADRLETRPTAGVFLLPPDGAWHRLAGGLTVANGPAFSRDGATLYLADSPCRQIYSFCADARRRLLRNRRVIITVAENEGFPDGLAVDATGCLWSPRWGGHSVVRYAPDGDMLARIELPARLVTSCAFGANDLSSLFITTAIDDSATEGDLGGHLFQLEGQRGLSPSFAAL
jgi:sugar lactone lactonase YvrE